jgi:hypothetical protein
MIGALVGRVPGRRSLPADSSAEQTVAVLAGARALIARGWCQGGWYVLQAPDGRRRFVGPGSLIRRSFGEIVQSCVVGAVVESARWHTAERGAAGPAIDTLWHELGELSGHRPAVDPWPPTPILRRREVGDLTTWNDTPGRSREDVLRLLDAAISRLTPARGARAVSVADDRDDAGGRQIRSASTPAAREAPSDGTGRYATGVRS